MNIAGRGDGRDGNRTDPTSTKGYDPYGMFNMATPNALTSTALGLIGAVTGIPTGLFTGSIFISDKAQTLISLPS